MRHLTRDDGETGLAALGELAADIARFAFGIRTEAGAIKRMAVGILDGRDDMRGLRR